MKKRAFFVQLSLSEGNFSYHLSFISMCSVLNTLPEYTYFYVAKYITSYTFHCLFLKSLKAFSVSLIYFPVDILIL